MDYNQSVGEMKAQCLPGHKIVALKRCMLEGCALLSLHRPSSLRQIWLLKCTGVGLADLTIFCMGVEHPLE